ncbi:MAG TPA: hypothetical protein VGG59_07265 [Acidobacteriaceae bacterium]
MAKQYRLHPLHVEDCRSHNERVKSEEKDEISLLHSQVHSLGGSR